jgi:hypothetical protein
MELPPINYLAVLAAAVSAFVLGGAITGLGFAATSFGISYLFEQRPLGLWLINGGYHVLQFTLYGIVLGLMGPYSV